MSVSKVSTETPGPPGVSVGKALCTPSPPAKIALGLSDSSNGSLSPLPLNRKRRKPVSARASPSDLPPAPKVRAVSVQSVELMGFASSEEELSLPSGGEDMDAGIGAEMSVEEEWESESSATADSDMTARGCVGDQSVSGLDMYNGSVGVGDADSNALEDQALGASYEEVMIELASHVLQPAQPVLSVPSGGVGGTLLAGRPRLKQVPSLYAPRLPRHLLSVPEGSINGDTAAIRRSNVRKYFSLSGAVIAVRHVRKDQVDDDVFEVEFATEAFLEKALMKEIAPGIFPVRVVPTPDPAAPTSTVKVLGVPPEASTQSLREAMVHHGTVQSVRLTPTKSGIGFVGYVTYQSSASGKEALEARYGFHGKERICIVHPAVTKEMESATP
jgi:RNA recognition motif. (a.k.a. RRM, RBD, or RNP domain)